MASDFFTVDTALLRTLYVLVFLEISSRRILYTNCTANPNRAWVTQQARNLTWKLSELESPIQIATTTEMSSSSTSSTSAPRRRRPSRSHALPLSDSQRPCERMIKTLRHEALDWLLIFGERHLRLVLRQYIDRYNCHRPHLALDLRPPQPAAANGSGPVLCQERLNGLINEYHRAA